MQQWESDLTDLDRRAQRHRMDQVRMHSRDVEADVYAEYARDDGRVVRSGGERAPVVGLTWWPWEPRAQIGQEQVVVRRMGMLWEEQGSRAKARTGKHARAAGRMQGAETTLVLRRSGETLEPGPEQASRIRGRVIPERGLCEAV